MIRLFTSSAESRTTYFDPVVNVIVVSGNDSTLSMYNAFNVKVVRFNLVTLIICKGPGQGRPDPPSQTMLCYRFKFTSSCKISSEVVMIRVLAWNPRCATIISVNSSDRSTLDISREPDLIAP